MKRTILASATVCLVILALFVSIFTWDNKYTAPPPYGNSGMLALTQTDIKRPVFLIDGWHYEGNGGTHYTYIGEYANLQHGDPQAHSHGGGRYTLTLDYLGEPQEVMLYCPALFFDYTIWLDGQPLGQGQGSSQLSFLLQPGANTLTIETQSHAGFYSGLYHPPILGATQTVVTLILVQCLVYGLAFFGSLVLALFTLSLWLRKSDPFALWFGGLCLAFALYLSYYFVRLFGFPFGAYWYLVQNLALYGVGFCALKLTLCVRGKACDHQKWVERGCLALSVVLLLLSLSTLWLDGLVAIHGWLTNGYCLLLCGGILWLALSARADKTEHILTKLACISFAIGLLYNLFASNLFEPIYTLWQLEWCLLFLVVLFGGAMVSRNRRILMENEAYQENLEGMVVQRTQELTDVLNERKAFFADMAHDLKAPVYATASFIQAIREHATQVDGELLRYIDMVEQKQKEMATRVQGLNDFNRMDGLSDLPQDITVAELLTRVGNGHQMAAAVQMVYLVIEPPAEVGTLRAPLGKLDILFENLMFNALKFTPPEGTITLSATVDEEGCHFVLSDTGCGIPPEEIPRLFHRFYVGSQGKDKGGSGLGLYIVKTIVDSLGGEITLSSKVGQGTVFFIDLPLK